MISIEIIDGARFVRQDDITRAENAALKILGDTDHAAVYAEYLRQFDELQTHDGMTGSAALWLDAIAAADEALSAGWLNPAGAFCTVVAA